MSDLLLIDLHPPNRIESVELCENKKLCRKGSKKEGKSFSQNKKLQTMEFKKF
jgi:hypothetical protein